MKKHLWIIIFGLLVGVMVLYEVLGQAVTTADVIIITLIWLVCWYLGKFQTIIAWYTAAFMGVGIILTTLIRQYNAANMFSIWFLLFVFIAIIYSLVYRQRP